MCKVHNGYHGTSKIEHDLCACTVDNPRAEARGLSLRTGAQIMLCVSLEAEFKYCVQNYAHVFVPLLLLFPCYYVSHISGN